LFRGLACGYLPPMSRRFKPGVSRPPAVHPLLPEAAALHQAGQLAEAAARYERIVAEVPGHFDATHLLGVIALQEGRFEQAEALIKAALALNPRDAAALSNLGTVYLRSGQPELACAQLERATRYPPVSVESLVSLGTVLRQLNRSREALEPLRRAHQADPNSAVVCNLLGACLIDIGEPAAAVEYFSAATRLQPEDADGWANLSIALTHSGGHTDAADSAERAIALQPRSSSALAALASIQLAQERIDEGIATYWEAVEMPDVTNPTRCAFAIALLNHDFVDYAIEQLQLALDSDPDNLMARWMLAMAQCKPIFDTVEEIEQARTAFAEHLAELKSWFEVRPRPEAFRAVGSYQPFYLAYQHFNNRDLLVRYGRLCEQWMRSLPATKSIPSKRSPSGRLASRKLRLGIVSAHVHSHSVWAALTKGVLKHLDRDRFELHLFKLDTKSDAETAWARQRIAHLEERPRSLQNWIAAIRDVAPDVLLYPEIGMDPMTAQLASLRLARLQATTWGQPQTSGLPTMDLFFSADDMEPPDAQSHYSERLVSLPHLGACVDPWTPTVPDMPPLGLRGNEPLLLCPGTPFKYSPVHDRVWARIARGLRKNAGGRLVFFLASPTDMNERLKLRLRRAFREERLDFDKEVYLLPFLQRPQFFALMQKSALMLDTLEFSGFNTAMQGIEAGLPVLAREGQFLRGRLASGIMRRLELPELVAGSDESFIEMAIQLAGDGAKRTRLAGEVETRRAMLFDDVAPIRALEQCLLDAHDAAA
jgi:predicted O-linked N-acetylglucosamine transferase (SPINDLY family)